MTTPADVESPLLLDLGETTLADLRARLDTPALRPYVEVLVHQVVRPRINLGTGPPGRVD